MLNIRLSRVGKRNYAQYKIVVAEKTSPVKGKFVEQVGSYDPHTKKVVVKEERVNYWISQGAGCSDTVYNLLVENKIIDGEKRVLTLKSKKSDEDVSEGVSEEKGDEKKTETKTIEEGSENSNPEKEAEKANKEGEEGNTKDGKKE